MGPVPEPALSFGALLRQLRDDAGLTQEDLAEAASLSPRSVSDLERGVNLTARKDTARLLAEALGLTWPRRARFESAARGRLPAGEVLTAGEGAAAAAATRTLPRDIASFTGRAAELAQLVGAVTSATAVGGCPPPGRPRPGWTPSGPTCTRRPGTPPRADGPGLPSPSPPRSAASCSPGVTGTSPPACTGAPWPPPGRPGTGPGRPVPSTNWASCSE